MAAETILGQEKRRQPDCFQDNIHTLKTLITKQNDLFSTWLRTRCPTDRQRYVTKSREVAHEIHKALQECTVPEESRSRDSVEEGQGSLEGTERVAARKSGLHPVRPQHYPRPGWLSVCWP